MVKKSKKSAGSGDNIHIAKNTALFLILLFSAGIILFLTAADILSQTGIKEAFLGKAIVTEECSKGIANISFEVEYNFLPGKNYSVIVASYHDNADNKLCERRGKVLDWENVTLPPIPLYNIDQHQNKSHEGKKENLVIDSLTNSKIDFSIYAVGHKKLHSKETFVILIQDLDCQPTKCKKHKEKCNYKTGICCDVNDKDTWLEMDEFYNFSKSEKDLYKKDCLDYSQCVVKIVSPKINLKGDSHHAISVNQTFGQFKVTRIDKIIPLKCLNCTDDDLDGFSMEGGACGPEDCDDADNLAYPGATEICNGIDDDCNNLTDDGCLFAPTVSITIPFPGAEFKKGIPITFSAAGSDFDGNITSYRWTSDINGVIGTNQTILVSSLSVGTHIITVTVTDNDGLKASSNITVIIEDPDSPVVSIISPNNGDAFTEGTLIKFVGSAIPQGGATISSIIWASNESGILYIGDETSFSTSTLSVGKHIITLFATDNHGRIASSLIQIEIKTSDSPSASIISPISRQFRVGQNIIFGGSATPHSGSITSQIWSSNINGVLGYGQTIEISNLSVGLHIITYTVNDGNGNTGTDTLLINLLENDAPIASVLAPSDGEHFKEGSSITFSGIGDGDTIKKYTWYSDINGLLEHKPIFSTDSLSVGKHQITLITEDNDGQTGTNTVTIFVMPALAPSVSIISPLDGNDYRIGDTIDFISLSSDSDGNITSFTWISDIDGILGSGESFSISNLSLGNHVITFIATDNDNKTSTASIIISMKSLHAPTASILKPLNAEHFKQYEDIEFIGSGSDPDPGGYIAEWQWSSSIDGVFGNNQTLNSSCLSLGKHDITLTVIDNDGLKYIDTFTIWIEIDPLAAPTIIISSPSSGTYKQSTSLFFDASTSAIQSWKVVSTPDGIIKQGTGNFVPFSYSNLSLGHHYITFEIFNHGLSNSETVEVWIVPLESPNVTILSPSSGPHAYGTTLLFNASIIGNWTSIVWNSDLEGNIGYTPEFYYTLHTAGMHRISVIVTNSDNQTTIVQIYITILEPPAICGNNIPELGEQCDPPSTCSPPYNGSCIYCNAACQNAALFGQYCGDGICNGPETCLSCTDCLPCPANCGNNITESGEQCDPPEAACTPVYGGSCIYCSACLNATLNGEYCGDGTCNGPETCSTCSADCGTCGGGGGGGGGPAPGAGEACAATWQCTGFGECVNGIQTRTCVDIYNCNTTTDKPAESQSCLVALPAPTPEQPLPAPLLEKTKPSLWPIIGALFIVMLGLFYLILKSEFLKLYTPQKTSMLIKGLYAFAALFCVFTLVVAFIYKDYLYTAATGVGAALTVVYTVFKEKIARFFFYKYII